MPRIARILIVFVTMAWPVPALTAISTVGANMGVQAFFPRDDRNTLFTVTVPSGPGVFTFGFQPGLRFGFIGNAAMDEFNLDVGFHLANSRGLKSTHFVGTANYQRSLAPGGTLVPFVTLGAGVSMRSFEGAKFVNPVFGGGIGYRHLLGHGHGSWRFEGRVDYIGDDPDGVDGGVMISTRVGFDLWLK